MEMNLTKRLAVFAFAALAMGTAGATDRVRAGQWETTVSGRAHVIKACISAAEAAALNGDERTLRAALEKILVDSGCTMKSLKLSGDVVVTDTVCGGKAITSTTTYHGDHYEETNSLGYTVSAKRVGDCKP